MEQYLRVGADGARSFVRRWMLGYDDALSRNPANGTVAPGCDPRDFKTLAKSASAGFPIGNDQSLALSEVSRRE